MTSPTAAAPPQPLALRERLRHLAQEQGFDVCRFATARQLEEARAAALSSLGAGRFAEMRWMDERWVLRATDPGTFLQDARTVVVVALACAALPPEPPADGLARGRVARYAAGRDYHRVFESKLRRLCRAIRSELGASARATVDYGPLLERPWAALAGLGWLGKSTMILVPGLGPWVLLGVVATDLDVHPDPPLRKTCGACTRCIIACPTGAISADGHVLDARLCISYHTIENRGPIPRDLRPKFGDWIFGCDDCLTSCPVGRHADASHPDFVPPSLDHARPPLADILGLDDDAFAQRFRGRAIMRAKRDGLVRNACVALGNTGTPADLPALSGALEDASPLVRGHAAWALGALAGRHPALAIAAAARLRSRLEVEPDRFARDEITAALAGC